MSLPSPLPDATEPHRTSPPPARAAAASRLGQLAGPAALLLIPALLFREAVFEGRVFYYRDIHLQWVGQMEALVRCVAAGSWPLWNPYAAFGQPLLANANNQVLYPPTWLNFLMAPWSYYTLFVVGHFALAAAGMSVLCRRLGLSSLAATVGAALWVASGPFVSLVSLWNHLAGAAWIPWAAWAAETALATGAPWAAVAWGAFLAAPILAGSPESALMAGLLSALATARHAHRWRRALAMAATALAVGAGLSAAQWVPSAELAAHSVRGLLTLEQRALWSLHPAALSLTVVPALLDAMPLRPDVRALLFDAREPYLPSLYLGLPATAMVAAALTTRRRLTWTLFVVGVLAALLALGRHGPTYELAIRLLPPLRALRFPAKALLIVAFAWAVLGAVGFEAWSTAARRTAGRRVAELVLAVVAILAVPAAAWVARNTDAVGSVLLEPLFTHRPFAVVLAPVATALAMAAGAAAVLLALSLGRSRLRPAWPVVAAVVLVAELLEVHRDLAPTAERAFYTYRPPALAALKGPSAPRVYAFDYFETGHGLRYLGHPGYIMKVLREDRPPWAEAAALRTALYPSVLGTWGVETSYAEDALRLYPPYLATLTSLLRRYERTPLHTRLLRLAGVTHVVALHTRGLEDLETVAEFPGLFVEPVRVFRVPDPLPRAYVVGGVRVPADQRVLAALVDEAFDPRREVVLERARPVRPESSFKGAATMIARRPDRIVIEAELSRAGHLVLADAYHPGWMATVDGHRAEVLRANAAFRAVPLGPGRHRVEFVYRPRSVVKGLAATGATLALLGGAAVWLRWRRPGRSTSA